MKGDLDTIVQRKSSENAMSSNAEVKTRRSIRQPGSSSTVYEKMCIVCEKVQKYIKGIKTREPLIKCVTKEADSALREAAVSKMDSRVTAALSRDAIGAEVHFHRTCYRLYTKTDQKKSSKTSDAAQSDDEYSEIEAIAFDMVCDYIRSDIFQIYCAFLLTELINMLITHMNMSKTVTVTQSTKKNFLSKLKTEFKNSIETISDPNGRVILYTICPWINLYVK